MGNFPICQIVGYKNAGKTTLMAQLIHYFSSRNVQVGTLKHHGHGGEPESIKDTDSSRHLQAGSAMSAVHGERQLHITINHTAAFSIHKWIKFYHLLPVDVLLIEGYKQADFPKIVLVRGQDDLHLLDELTNIIAVGSSNDNLLANLPYFTVSLKKVDDFLPSLAAQITDLRKDSHG